jgi:methyl-accepting chemotaxis protein
MKSNQPVTDHEILMKEDDFVVSTTDLKGRITSVNQTFIEISGFSKDELIGNSQNIVRYPDMPPAVFEGLWKTIKMGRSWSGIVKNRCKNGDYYWVKSCITPIVDKGNAIGHVSISAAATREEIKAADKFYKQIFNKTKTLTPTRKDIIKYWLRSVSIKKYIGLYFVTTFALITGAGFAGHAGAGITTLMILSGISAAALLGIGVLFHRHIMAPINQINKTLGQLSTAVLSDWINVDRSDEFGKTLENLKSVQVWLGYDADKLKGAAIKTQLFTDTLDNIKANVLLADSDNKIVYVNQSFIKLIDSADDSLRNAIPGLNNGNLAGNNLSLFFCNNDIKNTFTHLIQKPTNIQTRFGEHLVEIYATPLLDKMGNNRGTVLEWTEFNDLVIEHEVGRIVSASMGGDLSQRIDLSNMEGFSKILSHNINELLTICSNIIDDITKSMSAVAMGDLSHKINGKYKGSFSQLKHEVNKTITKLTEIMGEINTNTELVYKGSQEIAQGNADLSQRTEKQASSLEETASSMEVINATIKQNADNARQANQLAVSAKQQAEEGGHIVDNAVSAMSEITTSSNKMASIIGVIDEISFQTNLLALNAAVEAARAGDQGRGFAVVASEVRNLAGRSAAAAKEIKNLIENSIHNVNEGSKLVDDSGKMLTKIVTSVGKVNDIIAEIATASIEQSKGVEQVNSAVVKMDLMTKQNAILVEEAATASESMGEQTSRLNEMVGFFKSLEIKQRH